MQLSIGLRSQQDSFWGLPPVVRRATEFGKFGMSQYSVGSGRNVPNGISPPIEDIDKPFLFLEVHV